MARKPRIEFEGALYHVIMRGNRQELIFRDGADYLRYLAMVGAYKSRYPFYLYAYALMGNHVHLLVETRETPLSKILQCLNLCYAQYFNRKYETVGHLFQGRYKAILCGKDKYLFALIRYIHLNPVRAGIADNAGAYPWTSHPEYAGAYPSVMSKLLYPWNSLVDTPRILGIFSENDLSARRRYVEWMNEQQDIPDVMNSEKTEKDRMRQAYMANELYREHAEENTLNATYQDSNEHGEIANNAFISTVRHIKRREFTLDTIACAIETICGVPRAQLQSRSKDKSAVTASRLFSIVAKEYAYTGIEISKFVHKDPAITTRHLRFKQELSGKMHEVIETLSASKYRSEKYDNSQSQLSQT